MTGNLSKEKGCNSELVLVMCPAWGGTQPPVGIGYLKGFLQGEGIKVKCLDLSIDLYKVFPDKKYWDLNYPDYFIKPQLFKQYILPLMETYVDKWAEQILGLNPRIVGFSLFVSSINVSLLLARRLKELNPDLIIIGGGAEVSGIKRVLANRIADRVFDILIEGEGEEATLEIFSLLKKGRDFRSVRGCFYIEKGRIIASLARGLMHNLDLLPPPDYHDFKLESYNRESLPLVTSRGCLNRCTFCADSPLWKTYRYRSPEKVVGEIEFLTKEYKKRQFEITDSTFNGNIRRVDRICDLIIESKLDIQWSGKATLDKGMSYELLLKMKKAGCDSLAFGVESGSPQVLQDMRKNIELEEAKRIIRDAWRAGIEVKCFFIIGYPTETEDDFGMTLDFIKENAPFIQRFDQITGCHIEENSYLGLNLDKYGIILKDDGWYNQHSTPQIRKERLERFKELARQLHQYYQCKVQL